MPKYVLTPEYLSELEHFLDELTSQEQKTIITVYLRLCSDYINNTLSGKTETYILPKSTAFIIRAKYGVRVHLFTRIFDDSPHYNKARSLGILSFDAGLWSVLHDKHPGQTYTFSAGDGAKTQHGEIFFRTKSTKQKHRLHPDELQKLKNTLPKSNSKVKNTKSAGKYKTYKFIPKDSPEPVFYRKKQIL